MDFETLLREKYNFILKPQQRDAVQAIDGPVALLAVPGSGKTTVIAARCAYMVLCCGIAPENILTLSFNLTTQKDIDRRFHTIFSQDFPKGLRFTTIQSLCNLVLREYGALTGSKPPKLIEEGRRRILRSLNAELNDGEYLPDNRLEELANLISFVKNKMMTGGQIDDRNFSTRNFSRIFTAYEDYKETNGCMDYDDMPGRALAALNARPDLLERFRNQYRYINVDEAQETTKLQHTLIQMLAAPLNNLFMAGDEDQSMYGFKAADPEYLHDFSRAFPAARVLTMERNYRSTHAIVDAASRVIKSNASHSMLTMNTGNEIGMPVEETNLADNSMLYEHLVTRLLGEPDFGGSAILYRENTSAIVLMDALDREGIPFTLREQKMPYFEHWIVHDILAFMALAHNAADIVALKQIYFKLNTYISQGSYAKAVALMADGSCMDALDALLASQNISENAAVRVRKLKESITDLTDLEPGDAVQYIMEKLGYVEYLRKAAGEGLYLDSLLQIVESLKAIALRTASYPELLERIGKLAAVVDAARTNRDSNAVTLSTVQQTKGMEFKNVYIIDLFEGRFPTLAAVSESNDGKKDLLEEERRLFYIAVTRACKYVELIYASKINGEKSKPSRFIHELLPLAPLHRVHRRPMAKSTDPKAPSERRPATRRPSGPRPVVPKPPEFENFSLEIGMDVEHKAFGQGVISAYDVKRDIVAVKFQKHGVKTFAAAFCINGGVIKKPDPNGESFDETMQESPAGVL